MKTTIDIADDLVQRARKVQREQNLTLRALVEEGLRLALDRHERLEVEPFRLVTFGRGGLTEAARALGWKGILDQANER
jgi:hypothetical protein